MFYSRLCIATSCLYVCSNNQAIVSFETNIISLVQIYEPIELWEADLIQPNIGQKFNFLQISIREFFRIVFASNRN